MPTKDDVRVIIGADARRFQSSLKGADKLLSGFARTGARELRGLGSGFAAAARSMLPLNAGLGTLLGGGGLSLLTRQAIETADEIGKMASTIGVSTSALQEYRFAAGRAGVETATFDQALRAMVRRTGEAAAGNKEFLKGFQQVGLTVEDLRNLRPEQVFDRVIDGLDGIASQSRKIAAADRIFSEAGRKIINISNGGAAALARVREEAREAGVVLDENLIRAAERASDELQATGTVAATTANSLVLKLAPAVSRAAKAFREALPAVNSFFEGFGAPEVLSDKALSDRIATLRRIIANSEDNLIMRTRRALGDDTKTDAQRELEAALAEQARREQQALERQKQRDREAEESARTAAKARADALKSVTAGLRFEIDQLGRSEEEQRLYTEAKKAGLTVNREFRDAVGPLVSKLTAEKAALDASKEAAKEKAKAMGSLKSQAQTVFEETRTPLEAYQLELERLNTLVQQGAIDWETYRRAVEKARDELDNAGEKGKDTKKIFDNVSVSLSSGFADAIVEGKRFSEVLQGLVTDVAKLIIQVQLLNAIKAGASAFGFNVASAKGNVFDNGRVVPFAKGGVLTSPVAFPLAGGKTGTAAEGGSPEAIVPLQRGRGGRLGIEQAAANVMVNIYNNTDGSVQTRERSDGRGGKTIDVMIDEAVANNIGNRGSRTNRALRQGFGLNLATVAR